MDSITKKCNRCKEWKTLDCFHKNKYFLDGLAHYCKDCRASFEKESYARNSEKIKEKSREYSKKYYLTVKDRKRQYALDHKEAIKNRMSVYQKEYYIKNKERIKKKNKAWDDRFPEKRTVLSVRRRAIEINAKGSFVPSEWKDLCVKYDNKCLRCGEKKKLTVDHVVPLSLGGTNYIENIQPLCKSCNSIKGTKIIDYRTKE